MTGFSGRRVGLVFLVVIGQRPSGGVPDVFVVFIGCACSGRSVDLGDGFEMDDEYEQFDESYEGVND